MNFQYFWQSISALPRLSVCLGVLLSLLGGAANAELVEVLVSGSTDDSDGDIIYPVGGTFNARVVVDASYPDANVASPDAGSFFDFATSALISLEVTTPLGTVSYLPSAVTGAFLGPQVGQIQGPTGQTVNIVSAQSTLANDGFSGSITGLGPLNSFGFILQSSGPNDNFFTDPNVLFSGAGSLSTEADILGGIISLSAFSTGNETALVFGALDFSINPIPIPIPAAAWLFCFAIGSLGWLRRR